MKPCWNLYSVKLEENWQNPDFDVDDYCQCNGHEQISIVQENNCAYRFITEPPFKGLSLGKSKRTDEKTTLHHITNNL